MVPTPMADHDLRGWQNRVSEAIAYGLAQARVPFVVNLSSVGAEVPYGTGPIAGLHDHEERLDRLDGIALVQAALLERPERNSRRMTARAFLDSI